MLSRQPDSLFSHAKTCQNSVRVPLMHPPQPSSCIVGIDGVDGIGTSIGDIGPEVEVVESGHLDLFCGLEDVSPLRRTEEPFG